MKPQLLMKYIQLIIFLLIITSIVGIGHIVIYYALKVSVALTLKQEQLLAWILT